MHARHSGAAVIGRLRAVVGLGQSWQAGTPPAAMRSGEDPGHQQRRLPVGQSADRPEALRIGPVACLCLGAALLLPRASAAAGCTLVETRPITVTMHGLRPTILTAINGAKARFIIDTGATTSILSAAAAAQFKLPLRNWLAPRSLWGMAMRMQDGSPRAYLRGFGGGEAHAKIATVKRFTYLGIPVSNVPFLVGGNTVGSDAVGLLGDNVLRLTDTEYDFKDGIMRLIRPVDCGDQPLAYWAKPGQAVAVDTLRRASARRPQIIGRGAVNGRHIDILFDSGAPESILSLAAARRAGITPHSPGVVPVGKLWGIAGDRRVRIWRAPVAAVRIGTETIEHTHLLIADVDDLVPAMGEGPIDMLAGEDFFLSHHILVAYNQRKLYFTYSGGPVFDLGLPSREWRHGPAQPAASRAAGADGAELLHRGLAYAAQGEIHHALSDLERACRLERADANCRYALGTVYVRDKQPTLALKSFAAALRIQPNDVEAHLARAALRLARKHWPDPAARAAALAATHQDLNAVARLSAPEAQVRLRLGLLYDDAGQYARSIRQFKLWTRYHSHDIAMAAARDDLADARNNLCYHDAKRDRHLQTALRECTLALRHEPHSASFLDSIGLVNLRLGKLATAIADYDAALSRNARMAAARYGRGIAELRLGETRRGNADLAGAEKLDPRVAAKFRRLGLAPGGPAAAAITG